jgi:hypothetical protein
MTAGSLGDLIAHEERLESGDRIFRNKSAGRNQILATEWNRDYRAKVIDVIDILKSKGITDQRTDYAEVPFSLASDNLRALADALRDMANRL